MTWLIDVIEEFGFIPTLIGALFALWFVGLMTSKVTTQSECLRLGYRNSSVTWDFSRYCVTRSEQTDIVVPLQQARKR